jgi:hypothetical protein
LRSPAGGVIILPTAKEARMSVKYGERGARMHRAIPHDANDMTVLDTAEHPQLNFHRRILAIQTLMVNARGFPFDMIRRSAEEFDAQHASGRLPASAPQMLRERLPHYFERRTMAVEAWLVEQGFLCEEERLQLAAEAGEESQ